MRKRAMYLAAGCAVAGVAAVAAVVVTTLGGEDTATPPPSCQPEQPPKIQGQLSKAHPKSLPDPVTSSVTDLSESGKWFLGRSSDYDGTLWGIGCEPVTLSQEIVEKQLDETPSWYDPDGNTGTEFFPETVNSDGVVAGTFAWYQYYTGNKYHGVGWVREDNNFRKLTLPDSLDGKWSMHISDIGDDGTIVGNAATFKQGDEIRYDGDYPERESVPLVWEPGADQARVVDHESGTMSYATSISADGTIVGIQLGAIESGSPKPTESHQVWAASPRGDRDILPFDDLMFSANATHRFPKVSGDWVVVDDQRGKLDGEAEPEPSGLPGKPPEYIDVAQGPTVDSKGRVYGVDDAQPTMVDDKGAHRLDDDASSADAAYDYGGTSIDHVAADGSVVVGTRHYVNDGSPTTEAVIWH